MRHKIRQALLKAIRPIARALLRCGFGYKDFAEVSKLAFVQIATEEYGLRGRPTNISRVAVITGISRKEVGRIRSSEDAPNDTGPKGTPAGEVLHRWHTDAQYLDEYGDPKVLSVEGDGVSFRSLVRGVVGDIPPGAMKSELVRVAAVEETDDGRLKALKRHFIPARIDDRILHGLDTAIAYLGSTVAYNANPGRQGQPRFERVVSSVNIDCQDFEAIRDSTHEMLEDFTVAYDDFLSSHESHNQLANATGEIGVGFYFFERTKES